MSKKPKKKQWAKQFNKLVSSIGGKSNLNRDLKDIDNNSKHRPKGERK